MLQTLKRHRILISRVLGLVLIIATAAGYFWSRLDGVSEEVRRAKANVARMEAQMQGAAKDFAVHSGQSVAEAYYQSRKEHLRYALILVGIAGVGFMLYGWIATKREKER